MLAYAESLEDCVVARRPLKIAMMSWETLHTIAAGGVAPHVTELAASLHRKTAGPAISLFPVAAPTSSHPKAHQHGKKCG